MTSPIAGPELDTLPTVRVTDFALALASYLRDAHTRQHALMSAWGGPPVCHSCYVASSGATSTTFTVRVPPGVTDLRIDVLAWGNGTLAITSSVDATGSTLTHVAPVDTGAADEESAVWIGTGSTMPTSAGATSGRAVTVRSSVSWTWADVDLTLTISDVATEFGIRAIETRPFHAAR